MARRKYESLDHELQSVGYLTLAKTIKWLKAYHPKASISYPTALRMIDDNRLLSVKIGGQHRLNIQELRRFVEHGNAHVQPESSADFFPKPTIQPPKEKYNDIDPGDDDGED